MSDKMLFPKRIEEFIEGHSFKDDKEIYTNGSRLIPTFRVEQALEHYRIDVIRCKDCKYFNRERLVCGRPFETTINKRMPDDYCSRAVRRKDHANNDL